MTRSIGIAAVLAVLLSACSVAGERDFSQATQGPHFGGAAVTGETVRGPG